MRLGLGIALGDIATRGRFSTTPWTPLDLGSALKAWWNADDHGGANMTDDGAGLISSWKDRISGVTNTTSGTVRPTWTATAFNSAFAGLTFAGAQALLSSAITALPNGATAGELWVVASSTDTTTRAAVEYGDGAATATNRTLQRILSGSPRARIRDGVTSIQDSGVSISGPHMYGGAWAGTVMSGRVNGRPTTPATATIATLNTPATRMRIGANAAASIGAQYVGVIRHVFVTTTMTLMQQLQLEGWIAWDCNLASVLPADHNFKGGRPMK